MKLKKWVKVLIVIIGVLFLLFCVLVGIFVYKDLQMEEKLNREVEEIQNILDATEFDEEVFKKKLNNTVTTGDYYKVERAYKNYLRDYLKITNSITEFYDSMEVDDLLSMKNMMADGKDFINTRVLLDSYSNQMDKLKEKFDEMSDEKKVLTYLKEDVDDYYVDYYKEIIGDVRQTEEEKELSMYLSESSKLLRNVRGIFDFLSENKDHWVIEGDMILFDSQPLLDEYQALLNKITNLEISKKNENTNDSETTASDI